MNDNLYHNLKAANADVRYDACAKQLLADRQILAHILAGTVSEFAGMSPKEILPLLEADPQISAVSILPGETNSAIFGHNTENTVPGEGTVTFDVLSFARLPVSGNECRRSGIIFDVEAQNRLSPACRITPRGIYYDARLISFQKNRIFSDSHYEDIQKVYSIWLILCAPERIANTIYEYRLDCHELFGQPRDNSAYDLMRVVIVGLPAQIPPAGESAPLLRLLSVLFSTALSFEEKRDILTTEFRIAMHSELEGQVMNMCNWSVAIRLKAMEEGREQGADLLGQLILRLQQDGRAADITAAAANREIRNHLYQTYGLLS